ncbi:MAG: hypothetical protein K6G90_11670 [Clostridia bacterium]|nr:hypothetical protein [Clostridia bacterium]
MEKFKNLKNKNLIITFAVLALVIVAVVVILIVVNRGANKPDEEQSGRFGVGEESTTAGHSLFGGDEDESGRRNGQGGSFAVPNEEIGSMRETTTAIKKETVTKNVVVGTTVISEGGTTRVQEVTSKVTETVTVIVTEPPRSDSTTAHAIQNGETTVPQTEPPVFTGETAQIDAFINGYYYIEANMTDGYGDAQPIKMAKRGNDLLIGMNSEGMNITMMIIGDKIYMLDDTQKVYLELSQALTEMMDMDVSDLSGELSELDLSKLDFVTKNRTTETADGKQYTVYDYATSDGTHLKSYLYGGKLAKIAFSEGENQDDGMTMVINRFEYENLDRFFTYNGYTKTSLLDYASTMEGFME